jgi:hypothetical protein
MEDTEQPSHTSRSELRGAETAWDFMLAYLFPLCPQDIKGLQRESSLRALPKACFWISGRQRLCRASVLFNIADLLAIRADVRHARAEMNVFRVSIGYAGGSIDPKGRDKVKAAFKYQRCRKWIYTDVRTPLRDLQTNLFEHQLPFIFRPIIIGQRYAVVGVANPIHETERVIGKQAVHGVVFENDYFAGDALSLSQKGFGSIRMVKNVDETYHIVTIV